MRVDPQGVWRDIQAIKKLSPLVHNITNYVVMEQTANSLLALGASPVMAHALEEVEEMVGLANSLVLNIGTLSPPWIEAMQLALGAASVPVVLDPVGAGATKYRTETAQALRGVTAIRANASEVRALLGREGATKGVDSSIEASTCLEEAKRLAVLRRCVVWMSGKTDVVTDGERCILIHNGDALMSRVTGMGCTASALSGAFLAVNPDALMGIAHTAVLMGIAGEVAAEHTVGPGSFKLAFIDALHTLSLREIEERIHVE